MSAPSFVKLARPALVVFFIATLARDGRANMAKWYRHGEAHGPIVPHDETSVRVDSEELSFLVAESLTTASVSATYRLTNGGDADVTTEVAFVMAAAEHDPRDASANVQIDDLPIDAKLVTDIELLEPALDRWLAGRPEVEAELKRLSALPRYPSPTDTAALRALVPDHLGEPNGLLGWYGGSHYPHDIREAAHEAIPDEVERLQGGWSKHPERLPLSWLTFTLAIHAHESRSVRVRYTHRSGTDTSYAVNTVHTFDYLLSPARRWAAFGKLEIDVQLPLDTSLQSSTLPFETTDGRRFRASLPTLPAGELTFRTMSRSGLLFGITQPAGYWLLLLAGLTLGNVPTAWALGRRVRGPSRVRTLLACVFGVGTAALLWNLLAVGAVSKVFPEHAFGNAYDAAFGVIAVIPLFAMVAVVASLLGSRAVP